MRARTRMADNEYLPETLLETEDDLGTGEDAEGGGLVTAETLKAILADNHKANADLIRQMTTRPGPLQSDAVAPELKFTLEGLPDPQMDLNGFYKGVSERVSTVVGSALAQTRQAATRDAAQIVSDSAVKAKADAMVKAAIPGVTDEIIGVAAGIVANRIRSEGKDAMAELRSRTEDVAQDIVDYIGDMAATLGGGRSGRLDDGSRDSGRTRGLVQPRARAATRQATAADREDPRAFYKEFTAMQQKARIY